jgi:hypothetical protein
MWTIRPHPAARMSGSTDPSRSTGLLTKKSSWARTSGQPTSPAGIAGCGPVAFRTSTPIGPRSPRTSWTMRAASCSSVMSARYPRATPPVARMSSTTASAAAPDEA